MRSLFRLLSVTGLLFLLAYACQPDRDLIRDYPILTTNVSEVTSDRALLDCSIQGDASAITEYGFIWSTSTALDMNNGDKIILQGKPGLPEFSHYTDPALVPATTYYARAFVRAGNLTIYGNLVSFYTGTSFLILRSPSITLKPL